MEVSNLVVLGGGYSALSVAEEIRRLGDSSTRIILYTAENFFSRPNAFFRFKFPLKSAVDFGAKKSEFFTEKGIEVRFSQIASIDLASKFVVTAEGEQQGFDNLVFATGGLPNFVPYPVEDVDPSSDLSADFAHHPPHDFTAHVAEVLSETASSVRGYFVVRNVEEVNCLNEYLLQGAHVAIVGSGTLALDLISSIAEGRASLATQPASDSNHKLDQSRLTLISRKHVLGSALTDGESSDILVDRVRKAPGLSLVLGQEVAAILCVKEEETGEGEARHKRTVVGVRTTSGEVIRCDAVVQATGVASNVRLAKAAGLEIGAAGGVAVNERFETAVRGVFAVGDCAEVVDAAKSVASGQMERSVWKNWTAAREEAVACAQCIRDPASRPEPVLFHQSLKLFGVHISCMGHYNPSSQEIEGGRVFVLNRRTSPTQYLKLVFARLEGAEKQVLLIGSMVVGDQMSDFKLGMNVFKVVRLMRSLDSTMPEQMIAATFDWMASWKKLKEGASSSVERELADLMAHIRL